MSAEIIVHAFRYELGTVFGVITGIDWNEPFVVTVKFFMDYGYRLDAPATLFTSVLNCFSSSKTIIYYSLTETHHEHVQLIFV